MKRVAPILFLVLGLASLLPAGARAEEGESRFLKHWVFGVGASGHFEVEANDLIDILEQSFSSPTFEILKRSDEAAVVINAHRNPKFVEDVVRDILTKVLERYHDLPDEVKVTVRSESQESIHKHNAFAERVTSMRELRE